MTGTTTTEHHRRLIEIALCNDREAPRKIPVDAWLYQTKLTVTTDGEPAFLPVTDALTDERWERDDEVRRLNLQYRDRLEFAVGRTCSVSWEEPAGWDKPEIRAVPATAASARSGRPGCR